MAYAHIPLSRLFRDPFVARAFERAERDNGSAFAVPTQPKPVLPNSAAKQLVAS